jgi:SNF2 family DNA or RNA helicase
MSTDNYYLKEHIKRHIGFYTSDDVARRGRHLYDNGKVHFNEYIEKGDSWKFTVVGSQKYQVLVKGVNSFSGRILAKQTEWMRYFGLPESAVFDEYFSYAFTPGKGLMYYPSKSGEGLIPVNANNENYVIDYIRKLNNNELFLDKLPKKTEHRELGFVLTKGYREFHDYRNDYDNYTEDEDEEDEGGYNISDEKEQYRIVPVVGKPPKNNPSVFATHISEYDKGMDAHFMISKSENTEKLLGIIDAINERKDTGFQLFREAFDCLLQEKFVFGLKKNAKKIRKKDLLEITLAPEPYDVVFEVSKIDEFLTLELKRKTDKAIRKRTVLTSRPEDNYFYVTGNRYYFAKSEKVAQAMAGFPEIVKMVASYKDEFFRNVVEPVSRNFEVRFKKGTFNSGSVELDFRKKQLYLSERDQFVVFTPCVEYGNNVTALLNTSGNLLEKNGNFITEYRRNFELENDYLESLAELHPDFENQKSRKQFYLHYSDFTKELWFYRFFDQLQALNVELYGLKELKNFRYSPYQGKISTTVSSGQDWFEVNIAMSFGDNHVTLSDIKKAVINRQRYIQLKDGSVGILPSEWFHKLEKYFRNGEIKKDKLEISKLRFSIIDELFDNLADNGILKEIAEKKQRLKSFTQIGETKVPQQIKASLRHYQIEGLNWLNFLDEMQWGGILADDMGLGKTLQVLAFLQLQVNQKRGVNLVVVPTTLLFNWKNELEKFAPKLKALYYYGNDREKTTTDFDKYDLVITTYGILVRDIQVLSQYRFNYVVLDESQAIKNPASHRYKAASLIDSRNKIALTGTPIENSTFDLFAQMSFANRGFLGSIQNFKEHYSTPIDKDGNEVIASELNKIINPFVLRRTKEKVASELPDKTEDIIYCEMEPGQRGVYDAYRNEYRNRLLQKIEEDGLEKSKMMVLEALTRLRQICDSPLLIGSEGVVENQSVKIKELVRHITQKTGRHKILVFSQFVKMLGLIRDELAKLNIEFEYLDGKSSSKQREQSVNHFQENENLRVFLISLKAGGTGLNLTAADYVYVVDPWWNPAVENQAIDRCHRIGQDKKVFAYRMICSNTVEEKILDLQNKKKKIAGDIIQTDESILKKLPSIIL